MGDVTIELTGGTAVLGIIVAAVPAVVGWLIIRAVKGVDTTLEGLRKQVDELVKQDTQTRVEVADLRARLVHIEYLVLGKAVKP